MNKIERLVNHIAIDFGIILGIMMCGLGSIIFKNRLILFLLVLAYGLVVLLIDFIRVNRLGE